MKSPDPDGYGSIAIFPIAFFRGMNIQNCQLFFLVGGDWNHGILWFSIWNIIIPTDEVIFFRGVVLPPTRFWCELPYIPKYEAYVFGNIPQQYDLLELPAWHIAHIITQSLSKAYVQGYALNFYGLIGPTSKEVHWLPIEARSGAVQSLSALDRRARHPNGCRFQTMKPDGKMELTLW